MGLNLQTERSDSIMHDNHITILIWALSLFTIHNSKFMSLETWAVYYLNIIIIILYVHIYCHACYDTMYVGFMRCASQVVFKNDPVIWNVSTVCTFA